MQWFCWNFFRGKNNYMKSILCRVVWTVIWIQEDPCLFAKDYDSHVCAQSFADVSGWHFPSEQAVKGQCSINKGHIQELSGYDRTSYPFCRSVSWSTHEMTWNPRVSKFKYLLSTSNTLFRNTGQKPYLGTLRISVAIIGVGMSAYHRILRPYHGPQTKPKIMSAYIIRVNAVYMYPGYV